MNRRRLDSLRHLAIAVAALALLLGGLWVASQGGLYSRDWPKAVACVFLLVNSLLPLAALWVGAAGFGYPIRALLAPDHAAGHLFAGAGTPGAGAGVRYGKLLQAGTGMAAMLLLDWALGLGGWLTPWTAWGLCFAGMVLLGVQIWRFNRRDVFAVEDWPNPPWPLLPGLPLVGLYLVACCCPPGTLWATEAFGFDVMSYHLQLPREWLAEGRIAGLHHNVYSYLPNLVEAGYTQILAMRAPNPAWVYTAQFFHASLGIFATLCTAALVSQFAFRAAATVAGVAMLALPWMLITDTLAYDEMGALAFACLALLLLFDPHSRTRRGALLIGLLLGISLLAKLTVGAMFIPGVVLVLLTRLNRAPHWEATRRTLGVTLAAVCLAGVLAVLAPHLVRNALWTGNPVFPFAAKTLGRGHWDAASVERWNKGHAPGAGIADGLKQLGPRWLFNTGYGAVGGRLRVHGSPHEEVKDVARFEYEGGVPVFWLAALGGALAVLAWPAGRHLAVSLLLILTTQLAVWVVFSHHQARFLLPTVVPGAVLIGLGMGRLEQWSRYRGRWVCPVVVTLALAVLVANAYLNFLTQTPMFPKSGERIAPWQIIDSQTKMEPALRNAQIWLPGDHVLNYLKQPKDARVLLVADTSRLIDIHTPFVYSTVFDAALLGDIFRKRGEDAAGVTADLKKAGITDVWVNWLELARLQHHYGYDSAVTEESIRQCAQKARWPAARFGPADGPDVATLYVLP